MVPYLRAANVKDGTLDLTDIKEMNFSPSEQEVFSLRSGDVLVTEGSGSLSSVGASAVWSGEIEGRVCFQNTLLRLRPRPGTDPQFLAWWCRHAFADGTFAGVAMGANIFHVSAERVKGLAVRYIALAAQRGIADYLDTETARIDALIEKKRRMAELWEQRFRARQVALLTGTDHVHRVSNPLLGSLPAHWEAKRMKYCTTNVTVGVVVNPSTYFVDDGIPFVHGTDVREGLIDRSDLKRLSAESNELLAKSKLRRGDVVAMRVGYPGRAAIVPDDLDGANCASVLIFRKSRAFHPDLLAEFLNSPLGRLQIESVQYGAAQGVMNVSDAVDLVLPVPPQEEQGRVASLLQEARVQWQTAAALLGQQVDLLAEHRQALITAAVTGELDIPGVAA